jgi:hypothetical protein
LPVRFAQHLEDRFLEPGMIVADDKLDPAVPPILRRLSIHANTRFDGDISPVPGEQIVNMELV